MVNDQSKDIRPTFVVSLVSSPGSGEKALLESTLRTLGQTHRVAALVGDLATENDAARLLRSGAPVRQIVTGTVCHLEARMVERALDGWDLDGLDILFIENVGNLVCPASYDLGEDLRLVLVCGSCPSHPSRDREWKLCSTFWRSIVRKRACYRSTAIAAKLRLETLSPRCMAGHTA
jgi:hydrogenase accessory protein HypB